MIWIIGAAALLIPLMMVWTARIWKRMRICYHVTALVSGWIAGVLTADVLLQILSKDTVMMTEVHKIFYNPLFLLSAAYLGLFALYRGCVGLLPVTTSRSC
ncbi:hypothetical protein [Paenibacillus silviterrae]|uniref:hypothetical protein n=1 Tax=Paenibacillus silviterrae TaxID=3242194 RepID=UPI00254289C5|nr:hypothetical protein [Paenibacillus chinjuensis]